MIDRCARAFQLEVGVMKEMGWVRLGGLYR